MLNHVLQLLRLRTAENLDAACNDDDFTNPPLLKPISRRLCSFRIPAPIRAGNYGWRRMPDTVNGVVPVAKSAFTTR
jgi:hypothetical protein